MSRKYFAWSIIPFCLFLISMGFRIPNLTGLHSSPKPTPRAVLETTSKASHHAAVDHVQAFELCNNVPSLKAPKSFRSTFLRETCQFTSLTPPQCGARAPPLPNC
jgi:hypothetical protein